VIEEDGFIPVNTLMKGIYFVKVTSEKEQVTRKITVD
jgi:hypothetical protein